jgi:RND family efflux transporter MFP subunit
LESDVRRHAVLLCAAVLLLGGCHRKPPPAPPPPTVIVSKPLLRRIVDWDDFVGRFDAVNSVDIRPRVTGYLQSINFTDGQIVKKGQLLFVIDPRPYQAALDQAKGQLARAEAVYANARVELVRAEKLLAAHAISEQEYQTRLATERQAAGDVLTSRGNVETAALNLGWTRIVSPVTGRISDRRLSVGNLVTQDQTVLTNVVDIDPIWFSFYGAESLYLKYERAAQTGQRPSSRNFPNPVEIRLQDQPNFAIHGRMDFVDNALDPNSGTIRGRALVSNPTHVLAPGLFGHVRLLGSGAYQALLLPDDAIATQQSDQIVYVVGGDGVARQRRITTGPTVDGLRVVRSGLGAYDVVIISGLQRARQGLKVHAQPGRIVPPFPGVSPTPADLAPPPAAGTFAEDPR